ncbi:hypothetical protein GWI33_011696, partial [Rhynchophorus ferrugineus]
MPIIIEGVSQANWKNKRTRAILVQSEIALTDRNVTEFLKPSACSLEKLLRPVGPSVSNGYPKIFPSREINHKMFRSIIP